MHNCKGVYIVVTPDKLYIGQSKDVFKRISDHMKNNTHIKNHNIIKYFIFKMPYSDKIEREIYEQYQVFKYTNIFDLINIRNPMGGRMSIYYERIEYILNKYNLSR